MADATVKYDSTGTSNMNDYGQASAPPPGWSAPPPAYSAVGAPPPGPMGQPPAWSPPMMVQPTQQTVIIAQIPAVFGRSSQLAFCPHCAREVHTEVHYNMGAFAWIMVVLFILFCICLSCLPCCINGFKDAIHKCPNCRSCLGSNRIV